MSLVQQILMAMLAGVFATVIFGVILDKAEGARDGKKVVLYYIFTTLVIIFGYQFLNSFESPIPLDSNEPIVGVP